MTAIFAKSATKVVSGVGQAGVGVYLTGLHKPGVADDGGVDRASDRKYVPVEVHPSRGGLLVGVLDLGRDEISEVRGGRRRESGDRLVLALEVLRRCENRPVGRILEYGSAPAFAVRRQLQWSM